MDLHPLPEPNHNVGGRDSALHEAEKGICEFIRQSVRRLHLAHECEGE
jgi:hypothetical protein